VVKVVDFKPGDFPLTAIGSDSDSDFGFFHVRKLSRTPVVLLRCMFVPEIINARQGN
jgi:hypothetical protein